MGRKCSVEGCLSDSNRTEDIGVTFHKVPLHPDVRPKWISLCHIPEDKKHVKIIYVCSRHFLRADFCNFKGKKYMLKQGVLPSVFPWDKSKLEAIKAEAHVKKEPVPQEIVSKELKKDNDTVKDEAVVHAKSENIELKKEGEASPHQGEIKREPKGRLDEFEKGKINQANDNSAKFVISARIEALDFNNEWFPAKIVEVDYEENEVLIHFENFSNKYDEWVPMDSPRLRFPKNSENVIVIEKFSVGERCLAAWSDSRKFPATITKVMDKDSYEVLFDDGFVKVLKGHRISKPSPLFDPIKSSKQDRREKKRKINVAQLFKKKPRTTHPEEKLKKSSNLDSPSRSSTSQIMNESQISNISQDESEPVCELSLENKHQENKPHENKPLESRTQDKKIQSWKIQWVDGKPVGKSATLDTQDGVKDSIIVPDPRLPDGWVKHLLKRTQGQCAGKWDVVVVSPECRRFRSRFEVKKYLEENQRDGLSIEMFDFALGSKRRKGTVSLPKQPVENEKPAPEETQEVPVKALEPEHVEIEEELENSLKIIYEGDAYKCPIEGCGKNFRRENLAQMHVKHYHPEYTKYLDSTPNVADLAYARTVGERLDSSPGPSRSAPVKPTVKSSTPKQKSHQAATDNNDTKTPSGISSPTPLKTKDSEIIKLLCSKPYEKAENASATKPLPSGLPTNMYPEINLKDLLTKTEGVPKREDINIKSLCSSRPPTGLKTLLPVRPPDAEVAGPSSAEDPPKPHGKRKRRHSDNVEIIKGKSTTPTTSTSQIASNTPPPPPPPSTPQPLISSPKSEPLSPHPQIPDTTPPPPQPPSTSTPSTPQPGPPNNIIIEGGEVIKIVRMKQEEIINCTCGFAEEDGLMIQCELCLCWQHAYCNNIERESQVPDKYVCFICQNPARERLSRKYYHDQDWLKQGVLPVGSYHTRDEHVLQHRFEKLRKCNDLCGGILELREYLHSMALKIKIAESKNHPKLYLWSKPWDKHPLPEKRVPDDNDSKIKSKTELQDFAKEDDDKPDSPNESMLMMILKAGKEDMPKIDDLNALMDTSGPIIPQPEAAIDSADCKLNLLEHILHQESLVEERLADFEKQLDALEEGMNMELDPNYPKTRHTLQMLMRDLDTVKEFSQSTTI